MKSFDYLNHMYYAKGTTAKHSSGTFVFREQTFINVKRTESLFGTAKFALSLSLPTKVIRDE